MSQNTSPAKPPEFHLDAPSDGEMSPGTPAIERTNPFDDLAPPSLVPRSFRPPWLPGSLALSESASQPFRLGSIVTKAKGGGYFRQTQEVSDVNGVGLGSRGGASQGLTMPQKRFSRGFANGGQQRNAGLANGSGSPVSTGKLGDPVVDAGSEGWFSSLVAGVAGIGLGLSTRESHEEEKVKGAGGEEANTQAAVVDSATPPQERTSGDSELDEQRRSKGHQQEVNLADSFNSFSFPNTKMDNHKEASHTSSGAHITNKRTIGFSDNSLRPSHHVIDIAPDQVNEDPQSRVQLPSGIYSMDRRPDPAQISISAQTLSQQGGTGTSARSEQSAFGHRSQSSMAKRYNVPPPIPLRATKNLDSTGRVKVETGQGLIPMPSPVYKALRGEGNGYQGLFSPTSPAAHEVDPFNLVDTKNNKSNGRKDKELAQPTIKHPQTPPESPMNEMKKAPVPVVRLTPPRITPMSPDTPPRQDRGLLDQHLRIGIKAEEPETFNLIDAPEEEPDYTVAQKALEDHDLDPTFTTLYEIRDELGSGGFGFVTTAWSKIEGIEVAVKFIYKDRLHDKAVVRDWHRRESAVGILPSARHQAGTRVIPIEAAVLKYCRHPGIVGFKALYEDSTFFYLVRWTTPSWL